jgi:hypothetical protein
MSFDENFEDFKEELKEKIDDILTRYNAVVINVEQSDLKKAESVIKEKIEESLILQKYKIMLIYPSHIVIADVSPEDFIELYKAYKTKTVPLTLAQGEKFRVFPTLIFIDYGGYYLPYNFSLTDIEKVQNYVTSPIFVKSIVRTMSSLRDIERGYSLSTVILSFVVGLMLGAFILVKALTIL